MKEFLRREWMDQEIRSELYSRARERARKRLSSSTRPALGWLMVPAAVGLLAVIWLAFPGRTPGRSELARLALTELPLDSSRPRMTDPLPAVDLRQAPIQEILAPRVEPTTARIDPVTKPNLERLVMNFVLPRSGVRMIWIKQKFDPVGGE